MGQTRAICEDVLASVACTMICEYVMDLKDTFVALVTNITNPRIVFQCPRSKMEEARRLVDALCVVTSPSYFYLLRETRKKELFLDLCYCL